MSKIKDLKPSDERLTNLPPLPETWAFCGTPLYTEEQMRGYAMAAVEAAAGICDAMYKAPPDHGDLTYTEAWCNALDIAEQRIRALLLPEN
jgi:hypothetical protein